MSESENANKGLKCSLLGWVIFLFALVSNEEFELKFNSKGISATSVISSNE